MKKQNNRGITLIALVITIIVMLLLVAVTVTVAINGDLFGTARKGVDKKQLEIDRERLQAAVATVYDDITGTVDLDVLDEKLPGGFTGTGGTYTSEHGNQFTVATDGTITYLNEEVQGEKIASVVQVGDYIKYDAGSVAYQMTENQTGVSGEPQTFNTGDYVWDGESTSSTDVYGLWRVLSIDENTGTVEITPGKAITGLTLSGETGFLNLVGTLNTASRYYVNSAYALSGRSLGYSESSPDVLDTLPVGTGMAKIEFTTETIPEKDLIIKEWPEFEGAYDEYTATFAARMIESTYISGFSYSYGARALYYTYTSVHYDSMLSWYRSSFSDELMEVKLMPVITLKDSVTVTNGTGTYAEPYVLAPAN